MQAAFTLLLNLILITSRIHAQSMEQYQGDKVRCIVLKQGAACNKLARWAGERPGSLDVHLYRELACNYGVGASCQYLGDLAGENSGITPPNYYERGCDLANGASCLSLAKAAQASRTIGHPMSGDLVNRVHAALAKFCGSAKQESFCPQLRQADQGLERFGNANFKSCRRQTISFSQIEEILNSGQVPLLPAATAAECKRSCEEEARSLGLAEGKLGSATVCFFADNPVPPMAWLSSVDASACDATPLQKPGERENYYRPCHCMADFQKALNEQLVPLGMLAHPEFEPTKIGKDANRARCEVMFEFIPPLPEPTKCAALIAKAKAIGAKALVRENFEAEYQTLHCAKAAHP